MPPVLPIRLDCRLAACSRSSACRWGRAADAVPDPGHRLVGRRACAGMGGGPAKGDGHGGGAIVGWSTGRGGGVSACRVGGLPLRDDRCRLPPPLASRQRLSQSVCQTCSSAGCAERLVVSELRENRDGVLPAGKTSAGYYDVSDIAGLKRALQQSPMICRSTPVRGALLRLLPISRWGASRWARYG